MFYVVGIGSAGQSYLEALEALNEEYTAIETDPEIIRKLVEKGVRVKEAVPPCENRNDVVILATRARGRELLFSEVAGLGYKKVLLEKLLANSNRALRQIEETRREFGIITTSHNRWELLKVHSQIGKLVDTHDLGKILCISIIGGNFCAAAGGIHLFSLANRLHPLQPLHLDFNSMVLDRPSPRGGGIKIASGRVVANSPDSGFTLYVDLNSSGRMTPQFNVSFERGRVHFELGQGLMVSSGPNSPSQYVLPNKTATHQSVNEDPFREAVTLLKMANVTTQEIENSWNSSVSATKFLLDILSLNRIPGEQELPVT